MFYAGLDLLFMALSLHIIASLKVLENDFMDIDDVYQKFFALKLRFVN